MATTAPEASKRGHGPRPAPTRFAAPIAPGPSSQAGKIVLDPPYDDVVEVIEECLEHPDFASERPQNQEDVKEKNVQTMRFPRGKLRPLPLVARFNQSGTLVAAGYANGDVVIWDRITTDPCCVFTQAHSSPVIDLCWSHNGHRILTADTEGSLRLWRTLSGELERHVSFSEARILKIELHPTRSLIAVVTFFHHEPILISLETPHDKKSNENDGKPIECTSLALTAPAPHSLSCASFLSGDSILAGGSSGVLSLFSLSHDSPHLKRKWGGTVEGGKFIKGIALSEKHILINSADQKLRVFTKASLEGVSPPPSTPDASQIPQPHLRLTALAEAGIPAANEEEHESGNGKKGKTGGNEVARKDATPSSSSSRRQGELMQISRCVITGDAKYVLGTPVERGCPTKNGGVMLRKRAPHRIVVWKLEDGRLENVLCGPRMAGMAMNLHTSPSSRTPSYALTCARRHRMVYLWSRFRPPSWRELGPRFELLPNNEEFEEREDEFDPKGKGAAGALARALKKANGADQGMDVEIEQENGDNNAKADGTIAPSPEDLDLLGQLGEDPDGEDASKAKKAHGNGISGEGKVFGVAQDDVDRFPDLLNLPVENSLSRVPAIPLAKVKKTKPRIIAEVTLPAAPAALARTLRGENDDEEEEEEEEKVVKMEEEKTMMNRTTVQTHPAQQQRLLYQQTTHQQLAHQQRSHQQASRQQLSHQQLSHQPLSQHQPQQHPQANIQAAVPTATATATTPAPAHPAPTLVMMATAAAMQQSQSQSYSTSNHYLHHQNHQQQHPQQQHPQKQHPQHPQQQQRHPQQQQQHPQQQPPQQQPPPQQPPQQQPQQQPHTNHQPLRPHIAAYNATAAHPAARATTHSNGMVLMRQQQHPPKTRLTQLHSTPSPAMASRVGGGVHAPRAGPPLTTPGREAAAAQGMHGVGMQGVSTVQPETSLPEWNTAEVGRFVESLGVDPRWKLYANAMTRAKITGLLLCDFNTDKLVNMGFDKVHAAKLMLEVQQLKKSIRKTYYAGQDSAVAHPAATVYAEKKQMSTVSHHFQQPPVAVAPQTGTATQPQKLNSYPSGAGAVRVVNAEGNNENKPTANHPGGVIRTAGAALGGAEGQAPAKRLRHE